MIGADSSRKRIACKWHWVAHRIEGKAENQVGAGVEGEKAQQTSCLRNSWDPVPNTITAGSLAPWWLHNDSSGLWIPPRHLWIIVNGSYAFLSHPRKGKGSGRSIWLAVCRSHGLEPWASKQDGSLSIRVFPPKGRGIRHGQLNDRNPLYVVLSNCMRYLHIKYINRLSHSEKKIISFSFKSYILF